MVAAAVLAIGAGVRYYPIIIGHYWSTKPVAGKIRLFVRRFTEIHTAESPGNGEGQFTLH